MTKPAKHFRKRDAILEYLRATEDHPSAEMVYAALKPQIPDLSLGTVYRNLTMFRNQGLIVSVGHVNGVERFDGNSHPHVHFVCGGCNRVLDLHLMRLPEAMSAEAAAVSGGRVDECQLTFQGLCKECLQKGGESA